MATKSNNVLIHLKAIGADATAREINKVKEALGGLNDSRKVSADRDREAAESSQDLTKAMDAQTKAIKRQKLMIDNLDKSYTKQTTRALKNQQRLSKINSMAMAEERTRRRETIAGERLVQRAKDKSLREELRRNQKMEREYVTIVKRRNKLAQDMVKIPGFRRPFRVAMIGAITTLVADALAFVGTGLNALVAGGIAAVNGLAPLTGMLITLPAAFGVLAQSIAPATWGIGNFVKAWKGKDLKDAGKNTKALAKSIKEVKPEFDKLQKSVGDRFVKGFDKSFGKLATTYLPILRKRLMGTSKVFNSFFNGAFKWLSGNKGKSIMDSVMGTNNKFLAGGLGGMFNLFKGVLGLLKAAGPMLSKMSTEFQSWTGKLAGKIFGNQKGLGAFFDNSYKTFKGVTKTLGNFGKGLYHLFKQSAPLTKYMGDGIKKASEQFLKWTKGDGIPKIQKYFEDMKPNLKSVVDLAGSFAKSIYEISNSPNFAKTVDEISNKLLPALVDIVKASDGKFIPNLVKFAEAMAKLADSGMIDALSEFGAVLVNIVDKFANWFSTLDSGTQKFIVFAALLSGLFGGIASAIAGAMIKFAQFLALSARAARGGKGLFGGGPMAGFTGGGGKGGGKGGGAVIAGGGGGGKGKNGKSGSTVVTGGGKRGGSKPGKKTGSTRANGGNNKNNPAKTKPTRKGVAKGAAGGVGGALAFLAVGPATDQLSGVAAAMSDTEFKANSLMTTGRSLDGMFGDVSQGNMKTFDGALTQVANPTKYMQFEQGVAAVGGAILGATPPLDVAKAKFEGIDAALTNMPADQAATQFSKIRAQAVQLGIPMDKLTAQFPQYRDSVASTVTASDKAAGGMGNATVAANKMSGGIEKVDRKLMDVDSMQIKPKTFDAVDKVTPKAEAAGSGVKNLDGLTANPGMKANDQVTPKVKTASSALGGLNGDTANTHIKTSNEAPGAASAANSALNGINGKVATTYIKTVRTTSTPGSGGGKSNPGAGLRQVGMWTGGTTNPGQAYLTGERGPELAMTRGGGMMMLGMNGPEMFSPGSKTAIIPHGATRDPFSGSYGYAPDWAKRGLQASMAAANASGIRSSGGGDVFAPQISVNVNSPSSNVDVVRAIKDTVASMQRDREARR